MKDWLVDKGEAIAQDDRTQLESLKHMLQECRLARSIISHLGKTHGTKLTWQQVRDMIGDDAPEWLSEGIKATTKEVTAVAEDEDDNIRNSPPTFW